MSEGILKTKRRLKLSSFTPLLGIVFVFVLFSLLTGGRLMALSNLEVIINQAFTVCIMGVGGMFVYSHGGFDFSVGSCLGMCSLTVSTIILSGGSPLLALLSGVAFGAFSGFLVGVVTEYLRLTSFIASLCFSYIWRGLLQVIMGYDIQYMPADFCATFNSWYLKAAVLVAVFLIGAFLFNRTRLGKFQKAIGGSEIVSQLSGVPTRKYVILSHMIMGICVGIAAMFSVARAAQVYPLSGQGTDMDVMVAAVLGGMPLGGGAGCRMSSVIIGALTVAALTNGLTIVGVNPNAVDGITGVIFIAVVAISYRRTKGQIIR